MHQNFEDTVLLDDARLPQRFWDKVRLNRVTGCWDWLAYITKDGYGTFAIDSRPQLAHRVAYIALVREISSTEDCDHYRNNPGPRNAPCSTACVNPAHIEVVSHEENVRRGRAGQFFSDKTHCPKGHPYSGENLRVEKKSGARRCRKCDRAKRERHYKKNKARLNGNRAKYARENQP